MDSAKLAVPMGSVLKHYPELRDVGGINRTMTGDPLIRLTPNSDAFIFMRWVKNPQSISYVKRRDIRKLTHVFDLDVKTLAHLLGVDSDKMFRWLKPCKNGDDYIPIKRSDLSRVFKDLASHIPNSDKETLRKKAEAFDCENGLTKA